MITQTYTISTIKQSTPPIVKMSQYDHGSRTITFSVVDGSGQAVVLTGKTVRVEGTRLDGHAFAEDCTVSGNTASFTDTSDMTNAPGAHPAELVIESDGDRLGTMNFVISVETAAMDENADITEEDVSLFEQLLGSIEDATGAVEAEKTAALSAIDDDKDAALLAIAQGLASGSPLVVDAVADMTDQTAVYLYSGSESGYTAGNFYFWNGSAWVSGGTYGNPTVDAAFSDSSVNPVQNKVVSAAVSSLKSELNDIDVELYTKGTANNWVDVKGDATKVTGKFIHASDAEPATAASWNYYELPVSTGEQYLVRTYTSGWARCAVLVDSGGNVLATYPDENVTNKVQTHVITIPASCTKLYVNENTSTALLDFSTIEKNDNKHNYDVTDLFGSKVLSFVKSAVSVSGYESEDTVSYENIKSNGTKVEGYFFNSYDSTPTASAAWSYYWFNVKAGEKVKAVGYSAGWARVVVFTDEYFNILAVYPNVASTGVQSFEVVVPANAVKMFVNENSAQATSEVYRGIIEQVDFTSGWAAHIAHNVTGNKYEIGTDDYVYSVDLKDSYNGVFSFETLKKGNATFKEVSDDVTPLNIQSVRYVGAGHGYFFGYNLTISAHGYTSADIGKTYNDGTNTWVIIKIVNANTIQVVCYDSTAWYRMKTATTPDSVDFGSGAKTVTNSSQVQIYPSVINADTKILENTSVCRIVETYDIMNVGTGIDALLNNVGNNDNDSLAELSDSAITVRNLYEFINNGAVTIYQNLKVLNDNIPLDFYGAVQSGAFGNSDYYGVAETNLPYQEGGTTQYFDRSTWKDQNKPPILFVQTDGATGTNAFFTGYITDNRNSDIYDGGSAGFNYGNTRKMYPFFINPHSVESEGKTYNCVSFRIPCTLHDVSSDVAYACYAKLYDKYIMVIGTDSATNSSVEVPTLMQNKKCEVYMADGIEIGTKDIVDRIDVKSSGRGYAIIIA